MSSATYLVLIREVNLGAHHSNLQFIMDIAVNRRGGGGGKTKIIMNIHLLKPL